MKQQTLASAVKAWRAQPAKARADVARFMADQADATDTWSDMSENDRKFGACARAAVAVLRAAGGPR